MNSRPNTSPFSPVTSNATLLCQEDGRKRLRRLLEEARSDLEEGEPVPSELARRREDQFIREVAAKYARESGARPDTLRYGANIDYIGRTVLVVQRRGGLGRYSVYISQDGRKVTSTEFGAGGSMDKASEVQLIP